VGGGAGVGAGSAESSEARAVELAVPDKMASRAPVQPAAAECCSEDFV
jgi:hypothetical protein